MLNYGRGNIKTIYCRILGGSQNTLQITDFASFFFRSSPLPKLMVTNIKIYVLHLTYNCSMQSAVYLSCLLIVAVACMQQVYARHNCTTKGLICQDDEFCCDPHKSCCKNSGGICCPDYMKPGCCDTEHTVCCPNKNMCCAGGYPVCCESVNMCCAAQYPVCCNGWCCQTGAHCCGGRNQTLYYLLKSFNGQRA